jgi:hypothetical protein
VIVYVPYAHHLVIPTVHKPGGGWVQTVTAFNPVVWLRMNTASGTENNLGSGGGTVDYGGGVTRSATGGPVAGSGKATTTGTTSSNMHIRSQISTMWTTFTCSVFVKLPASGNTSGATIFSKREYFASAFTSFPFNVEWDQTNKRLQVSLDSGNDFTADQVILTDNNSIPTDEWVLLTIVVRPSGSPVEIFKNGSLLKSVTATTSCNTTSTIPKWGVAQSNEYSSGIGSSECVGEWSEFFVCNSALTSTQVSNLWVSRNIA